MWPEDEEDDETGLLLLLLLFSPLDLIIGFVLSFPWLLLLLLLLLLSTEDRALLLLLLLLPPPPLLYARASWLSPKLDGVLPVLERITELLLLLLLVLPENEDGDRCICWLVGRRPSLDDVFRRTREEVCPPVPPLPLPPKAFVGAVLALLPPLFVAVKEGDERLTPCPR